MLRLPPLAPHDRTLALGLRPAFGLACALGLACAVGLGTASQGAEIAADSPPDPARAPVADAAWEPAHWETVGDHHAWVEGRYVQTPAGPPAGTAWEPGRWVWQSGGWVWFAGRYRTVAVDSAVVAAAPAPAPDTEAVVVDEAPPPVRVEVMAPCPGPEFCFVPGFWCLREGAWHWTAGAWRRPPLPGACWIGPRWSHVDHGPRGGVRFVPGFWRR